MFANDEMLHVPAIVALTIIKDKSMEDFLPQVAMHYQVRDLVSLMEDKIYLDRIM